MQAVFVFSLSAHVCDASVPKIIITVPNSKGLPVECPS